MNVSRRRYMGDKGESIPYQRIEYLESTGTQKITLAAAVGKGYYFEVSGEIYPQGTAVNKVFINSSPYVQRFTMSIYSIGDSSITYASQISNNGTNGGMTFPKGQFSTFTLSTEGITINGVFKAVERAITTNTWSNISVFTNDSVRLKWLKVKRQASILYDLIPVRVGQVGYMYDKVSGELYGNDGTGDFVLGSDIN